MDDLNLGTDNTQQQAPVTPQQETPESLHARAMTHLHNARDLYLKQLQTQAPTPEHHKMGLGIMAAALAAAALDPTQNKSGNNAGTAFYNHYKAAQQQRDEEQNQRNQSRYQHQGQIAMARSGFETEDAARLLQDKKDLEDEAEQDRKDKRQDKVDEFNQAMKKAALDGQNHRAEIGQKAKDIEGWRKLMGSQIPAARVIGAHGLKAEIEKDRPGVQEAGYNPTDLEKSIEDSFKTISNPTPKDQAAIDLSGARKNQIVGKTKADAQLAPLKQDELKARTKREQASTDLSAQRQKNLAQTFAWAPKEFQAKLAKTYSDIDRNRAMIDKAHSSGKSIDPNAKWILAANRDLSDRLKETQTEMKNQQAIIKTNQANATSMDDAVSGPAKTAISDARTRLKNLQGAFDELGRNGQEIGNLIRKKAGVQPLPSPGSAPKAKPKSVARQVNTTSPARPFPTRKKAPTNSLSGKDINTLLGGSD